MTAEQALQVQELKARVSELETVIRNMRTPFASTYSHAEALERLREVNRMSYRVLGVSR